MEVLPRFIIFFLLCSFSLLPSVFAFNKHDFLLVPSDVFISSLNSITRHVDGAKFHASVFLEIDNAIVHCLNLLDDTSYLLHSTKSRLINPNGTFVKSGNPSTDMRTWLSGVMVNCELCLEELQVEGPKSFVRGFMHENNHIRSGAEQVLGMVRKIETNCSHDPTFEKNDKLPSLQDVDVVVSKDGTGNYTTIMDAVNQAPNASATHYVIYVKEGHYNERVVIDKTKVNLVMVGDGMDKTIISFNRSNMSGFPTMDSATFDVSGGGFLARDMKIENTAGPEMGQAVALRVNADLSVFYKLHISGYQDTLFSNSLRQFYKECRIAGTTDFIFGNSKAVFQNCSIVARKSLPGKGNMLTANGQESTTEVLGFSFQFCDISGDEDLVRSKFSNPTYLGRPWRLYSTTVFMQSNISNVIKPEGWASWNMSMPGSETVFYGEYMNIGDGSNTDQRADWRGVHVLNKHQARNFTVAELIDGNCWLPATGVNYTEGLGF